MTPDRQPTTWSLFLTRMVRQSGPLPWPAHEELSTTSDLDLRRRWLGRKDCPTELLGRSLATCTDRATFGAHFDLLARTPTQLEMLLNHEDPVVVVAAALHPNCPDVPAAAALRRLEADRPGALKAAFFAAPTAVVPAVSRSATAAAFIELAPLRPKSARAITTTAGVTGEIQALSRRIRALHPPAPATRKVLGTLIEVFPLCTADDVAPVAKAARFIAARTQTSSFALAVDYWAVPREAIEHMAPGDVTSLHPDLRDVVLLAGVRHPDPVVVSDAVTRLQSVATGEETGPGATHLSMRPPVTDRLIAAALANPSTPEEFTNYLLEHAGLYALTSYIRGPRFDPRTAEVLLSHAEIESEDAEWYSLAAEVLSRVDTERAATLTAQLPLSAVELLLHHRPLDPGVFTQVPPVGIVLKEYHDPAAIFSYLRAQLSPQAFEAAVLLLESFSGSLGDLVTAANAVVAPTGPLPPDPPGER